MQSLREEGLANLTVKETKQSNKDTLSTESHIIWRALMLENKARETKVAKIGKGLYIQHV